MSLTSAVKPKTSGGVLVGPTSATMPTSTSATATGFTSVGHISDGGVERSIKKDSTVVKAWGGGIVAVVNQGITETFKFKMIDIENTQALGLVFDSVNTSNSEIVSKIGDGSDTPKAFVIDTILTGNSAKRIVIPKGVVTDIGNITYKDSEVLGYEVTITAIEDSSGFTSYEYTKVVTGTTGS